MADDRYLEELLDKEFGSSFKFFSTFKDIQVLPKTYEEIADEIENFEVRDNDVWVTSFPKCGTTWVQEMVWLIGNDLDYEQAKVELIQRFPFLEYGGVGRHVLSEKSPECIRHSIDYTKNIKGKRFIKSHLAWDLLPAQIRDNVKQPKIIHVIRNPKDTCVSYFHFNKLYHGYTGTLETYVKLFLGGKILYGPYWSVIMSYWNRKWHKNLLIIKYEDMKKDLPSVIRQVAKFLDKQLTEEEIEKLAHHLSFEQMKSNQFVNGQRRTDEIKAKNPNLEGSFMRKGEVGDFKNTLTDEMIKSIEKITEEKLAGTGLTFEC